MVVVSWMFNSDSEVIIYIQKLAAFIYYLTIDKYWSYLFHQVWNNARECYEFGSGSCRWKGHQYCWGRTSNKVWRSNIGLQCVLRAAAISSCLNAPVVSYRVINRSNPSWKLISSIVCMADQVWLIGQIWIVFPFTWTLIMRALLFLIELTLNLCKRKKCIWSCTGMASLVGLSVVINNYTFIQLIICKLSIKKLLHINNNPLFFD